MRTSILLASTLLGGLAVLFVVIGAALAGSGAGPENFLYTRGGELDGLQGILERPSRSG
ncbi:hypothetical protein KXR53_32745 [Inquilinus limosus]|uniref:hypothetical protein n=1 Tax=Inquilinus limosus TaxID=171674 RepID=UPI003F18D1A6